VGTAKVVTATGYSISGAGAGNYTLSAQPTGITANITAKSLTLGGVTATNKVYDGATTATLSGGSLTGIVGTDVVTITAGTGSFADKNVGTAKVVTATGYALSGAGAGNYTLSAQPTGITANITAVALTTGTPTLTLSKAYDGTASAVVTPGTLTGVLAGDAGNVTLTATATYNTASVGTGKTITVVYALTGTAAVNYTAPANYVVSTGAITSSAAVLTAGTPTLTLSKVYDGTTSAVVTPGTLTGVLAGDASNVTLTATATYNNANVGTGKTITVVYALTGSAAGNYTAPANYVVTTGAVTAKSLTISGVSAANEVYDGTTTATLSGGTLSGVVGTDVVTITAGTGTFADKNVGTAKVVTATGYSISGAGAGNYTLSAQPTGITA
ncbi:filamentous hemagglutinin, partial [bacterium]|nr:filamentous hemagglutinin [bacterium]